MGDHDVLIISVNGVYIHVIVHQYVGRPQQSRIRFKVVRSYLLGMDLNIHVRLE